ncbi:MAG TPA: DUF4375 domain-containing protein [Polyangiaceae bacterium]|nr:DUF4375 domain-containing protein [Polyangiaceae bacterium]
MPIYRKRPPLTETDIADGIAVESARHAFWRDRQTPRPIDEAIAGASPGQVILYCVPYFDAEVRNGGFHQYFMNPTGDAALITREALEKLGEDERAKLLVSAMARFPGGAAPRSQSERQAVLSAISYRDDWRLWIQPMEAAYYALDSNALARRIQDYVESHPQEFFVND